jgi:hypothetical protein
MKKKYILIQIILASASLSFAQTIPNGNFEMWANPYPFVPIFPLHPTQGWECSGGIEGDSVFISKMPDGKGGSAMRLRNVKNAEGEIVSATAFMYIPSKNVPAKLSGRIKYRFGDDEAGMIGFGVKTKTGLEFVGIKNFKGVQPSYVSFDVSVISFLSILLNNISAYDSVFLMVTTKKINSSDFSVPIVSQESSFIEVDDLAFSGTLACCQFPVGKGNLLNPNFESFEKLDTSFVPSGWYLTNYLENGDLGWFEKSRDAQSGISSLKIKTGVNANSFFMFSFFQKNAGQNFINLYTKYNLLDTDSLFLQVSKYSRKNGFDDYKDSLLLSNASQANFAPISLSLKDFAANDTIAVGIFYQNSLKPNFRMESENGGFWIDDVSVTSQPLGLIDEKSGESLQFYVSPNPLNSNTKIYFTQKESGIVTVELFDLEGNLVQTFYSEKFVLSGKGEMDLLLENIQEGMYMLRYVSNNQTKYLKVIKQ